MIGDTVTRLGTGRYAVTRPGVTTYVNGRPAQGMAATFSIDAHVQPASGRELLRLPEGERSGEHILIFTTILLRTTDAATGRSADRITYQNRTYEIEAVEDWNTIGGFYQSLGRKIEL